jgi:deoxyhypusine monooxygenase
MAPSAVGHTSDSSAIIDEPTILTLRKTLTTESAPLALRFRALFSLKHLASQPDPQAFHAIQAIAAAFSSPSALLKHELAYCLGQTRNLAAVPYLRAVLENKDEDSMCRHEAAEALGALGDVSSLDILRQLRDAKEEVEVVRETCEIAVARIEWENSQERNREKLRHRYIISNNSEVITNSLVTLLLLTPRHHYRKYPNSLLLTSWRGYC